MKNGKLEEAAKYLKQPNGIGFSPDNKFLYVSDTETYNIKIYKDPLTAELPLMVHKIIESKNLDDRFLLSDGIQIDEKGYIWTSSLYGVSVIDPVSMKYVARIYMGTAISNLTFGKDGDAYITGSGHVWKIKTKNF